MSHSPSIPTTTASLPETGYLRLPDILRLIPVGKTTWWNGVKAGRFPAGVKLGPNTTAWRIEDIRAYIANPTAAQASSDA